MNTADTETQGQKGTAKGTASAAAAVGQNRLVWGPACALEQSEEKTEPYKCAKIFGVMNTQVHLIIHSTVARKGCSNTTAVPSKKLSKFLIFSKVQCQSQNWHCLPMRSVGSSYEL